MHPAARPGLLALLAMATILGGAPAAAQGDAAAAYEEGVAARRAGRHKEAIERFNGVLANEPQNVDARVQLGLSLAATRRLEDARREFNRVLESAPEYHDARIGLARIAFWRGRLAEAQRELELVRKNAPANPEAKALAQQIARARRAPAPREPAPADAQLPPAGPATRETDAIEKAAAERDAAAARAAREKAEAEAARAAREKAAAEQFDRAVRSARLARRAGRFVEAERTFRSAVARFPRDADLWTDLGLALAFQGRFAEARPPFERALALNPRAYDALLGLARLDLYTDALDSAEARVAQVLAALPTYRDAQALRARIRLARGDEEGAEAEFRALATAHPRELDFFVGLGDALRAQERDEEARAAFEVANSIDPTSIDVRNRLSLRARPRWRLDLDAGASWLTEGLDPWQEGRIGLAYRLNARTTLSGAAEVSRRFGRVDVLLDLRVDHRWSTRLSTYFRVGGTPDADFRPEFLVDAGGRAEIARGAGVFGRTFATLDLGYARYGTGEVATLKPGVQQYLFEDRFAVTGQLIETRTQTGDWVAGYLVRADWMPTERLGFFLGYSDAPDASEGKIIDTRSVFGGLTYVFDDSTTVRVSLAHEDRRNSYDRTTINVGVSLRF